MWFVLSAFMLVHRFRPGVFSIIEGLWSLISTSSLPTFLATAPYVVHGRRRAVARWIGVHSELCANTVEVLWFSFLEDLTSCVCGRGSVRIGRLFLKHLMAT